MALMEALPFASWFKDEEGSFNLVSRLLQQFTNKKLPDIIGKKGPEVFDMDEAWTRDEDDQEVHKTGKPTQSTYSKDNRIYKTIKYPVLNNSKKIIGTGGYQEDITTLSSSLQALHREREYLEALLENMPYYIFITDENHKYLRINSMMAKLLRVSGPEDAIGKGNEDFFSKRVARKMLEEDRLIHSTGNAMIDRIIYFEDTGIDGLWMSKNKIPIRDERGVITMTVGIFKDVSDKMETENELKKAISRAEESDRLKTAFLANMSHEIRTPMNGIIGFGNLLREPSLTEEQKEVYLKHIDTSSRQLLLIIDDIIDISKIESGQLKISNKPVRINNLLEEIYSSYFHRIRGSAPGQKKVTFNLEKGENSPVFTIVADAYRLRQIFNNLVNNAIKFTSEGHITIGYNIKNNRYIEFFVKDSGIGIPSDKMDIIFDRFGQVSTKKSYQPSGTGLGLPISRNLIELMGGEMLVESDPKRGSTFSFTLPLVLEKLHEEPTLILSNKSYDWLGRQILVAEDEDLNWLFIREMLRKTGADIHRAENGEEVLNMAKKMVPDIILMDIKMPKMDGFEATRRIRHFNKVLPIIAQSAFVMAEEKDKSMEAGCNHFVTKPIDRTVLMELINSYFTDQL